MSKIRCNRERGALALYCGKSEKEAMETANLVYSPANARRFRNSPDVRARLEQLFAADRAFFQYEAMRAMNERKIIAYSNIMDYCRIIDGQIVLKDDAEVPAEAWRAVSKIKPTKLGIEITLYDKNVALAAIQARVDPVPTQPGSGDDDVPLSPADQVASWDDQPTAGARAN